TIDAWMPGIDWKTRNYFSDELGVIAGLGAFIGAGRMVVKNEFSEISTNPDHKLTANDCGVYWMNFVGHLGFAWRLSGARANTGWMLEGEYAIDWIGGACHTLQTVSVPSSTGSTEERKRAYS